MLLPEKQAVLKDGTACLLRIPRPEDAALFLEYLKTTAEQTPYLLRYPEEVTLTVEEERAYLEQICAQPQSASLSAWVDGRLAGNASCSPIGTRLKVLHRAVFGIAIKKDYWGLGLGRLLTQEIISAARSIGYEELELEVAANNTRAIRLYESCGFARYGTRPNAFRYKDGSYADEHLMAINL